MINTHLDPNQKREFDPWETEALHKATIRTRARSSSRHDCASLFSLFNLYAEWKT
jgi:hypothetical protein